MFEDFDKQFERNFSTVKRFAFVGVIVQVALIGAVIWGIVKLVTHFAG